MKSLRIMAWFLALALLPAFLAWSAARRLSAAVEPAPDEPRAMSEVQEIAQEYQRAMHSALQSTTWVDRPGGVARVPIEQAMHLLLERGLPFREPATGTQEHR